MYGLTVLGIRVLLYAISVYCRREHLFVEGPPDEPESEDARPTILAAVIGYLVAIGIGLAFPVLAVALYCAIAFYLVIPFGELGRLLFRRL